MSIISSQFATATTASASTMRHNSQHGRSDWLCAEAAGARGFSWALVVPRSCIRYLGRLLYVSDAVDKTRR